MNYCKLIIILISSISFVLAYSNRILSDAELTALAQIIAEEDNLQRIAGFWGNRRRFDYWRFQGLFEEMLHLNRIETFKYLYCHLNLTGEYGHVCNLIHLCVSEDKQDIFDFLMSRDHFQVEEFVYFVRFKMSWCRSDDEGFAILETVRRVSERQEEIAKDQAVLLIFMMKALASNMQLGDMAMANVIGRLIEMGAVVDGRRIAEFNHFHPNHHLTQCALTNYQCPEIKEPDVN